MVVKAYCLMVFKAFCLSFVINHYSTVVLYTSYDVKNGLEDDSTTPEATELVPAGPRITCEGCPYSLRKKISVPKRYQQARDDL